MALAIDTPPAIEPITISQAKQHLRLDSGTPSDNITTVQSIAPGSHAIAASYSLVGSGVDVLGYDAIVNLNSGTNGAGGTVNVKIQESDDNITYTDWAGGAFTQVTTANDNAVQEKAYTGTKQYIRPVVTVAGAACVFGIDVLKVQPYSAEDNWLTDKIVAAREYCEDFQNRRYITQTWELWLDSWPRKEYIRIPLPPLQAINSIKYYGTDNTEYTMTATDYYVDIKSQPGRVALAYSKTWPTTPLRPVNGVCVEFDCGYGDAASDVPKKVTQAMLMLIAYWNENREAAIVGSVSREIEFAVHALLWQERIVPV